jgi:anti-sigma regulatory factor (Ser/Thr protein kinase)
MMALTYCLQSLPGYTSRHGVTLALRKRSVQFINEVAELPNIEKEEVATAFREILLNAIEHGGRFDGSQSVEIAYLRARHVVTCRVKDAGPGFSKSEIGRRTDSEGMQK